MSRGDLPIVSPPFETTGRGESELPRVAGVVLAAGTSTRFGDRNKLLERVAGAAGGDADEAPVRLGDTCEPLVRAAARTLLDADLSPVVVVVGHEADRVAAAVEDLPVTVVHNQDFETGQASTVRAGIEAVAACDPPVDAAVVALGDMPFVAPETVRSLVDAYAAGVGDALAPIFDGQRGNPVLFDRRFFAPLTDVEGDVGGRALLLGSDTGALVAVDDPGVRRDVDEPSDL